MEPRITHCTADPTTRPTLRPQDQAPTTPRRPDHQPPPPRPPSASGRGLNTGDGTAIQVKTFSLYFPFDRDRDIVDTGLHIVTKVFSELNSIESRISRKLKIIKKVFYKFSSFFRLFFVILKMKITKNSLLSIL